MFRYRYVSIAVICEFSLYTYVFNLLYKYLLINFPILCDVLHMQILCIYCKSNICVTKFTHELELFLTHDASSTLSKVYLLAT